MIVIGEISGIVIASEYREFKSRPVEGKEQKDYKLNEITFFAPSLNITGILKDWTLSLPAESLKSGDKITISYDRCSPSKGMRGVYDFGGFVKLAK